MDNFDLFFGVYQLADDKTRAFMRQIAPYMFEPLSPELETMLSQAVPDRVARENVDQTEPKGVNP